MKKEWESDSPSGIDEWHDVAELLLHFNDFAVPILKYDISFNVISYQEAMKYVHGSTAFPHHLASGLTWRIFPVEPLLKLKMRPHGRLR